MSIRIDFETALTTIQNEIMDTELAEPLQFYPPLFRLDFQIINFHTAITTPVEQNLAVLGDINGGKENLKRWLVAEGYALGEALKSEVLVESTFFFTERLNWILNLLNSDVKFEKEWANLQLEDERRRLMEKNEQLDHMRRISFNRKGKKSYRTQFKECVYESIKGELNEQNVMYALRLLCEEIEQNKKTQTIGEKEQKLNFEGKMPEIVVAEHGFSIDGLYLSMDSLRVQISNYKGRQINDQKVK